MSEIKKSEIIKKALELKLAYNLQPKKPTKKETAELLKILNFLKK